MITIDDSNSHIMSSHIRGDDYLTMLWPKNMTAGELALARQLVNLQLDQFIAHARRKTEREEAADLEYESWFAQRASLSHQEQK